ncbi:unnamed protein product [Rotaria sordida]|uniref:Uncharacterized protein n=1 Tax=Rotaria sordida TaxID=392033 RepID=A0A814QPT5_9BILA|nr:unnamed protein product [Rotaria sordida]CAF1123009.1 unnamed protein product [Rotaria sordida]CAF1455243.1 unnamed protein product [Rotaria sordida]CAF1456291.1 unnamed protein product [Rotaria sordida]CAF4007090.1 unnamed protein product [Rotaria sordida]
MTQAICIPLNMKSKFGSDPLKSDWNDFQHLATQSRYLSPKKFAGFQPHQSKLAAMKKQLYNPRLPTIRHMERDDVLCRLPDEHCRHTTSLTTEQFENFDPTRDDAFIELFGLNWYDAGKTLMDTDDSAPIQREPTPVFGARSRPDKSQIDIRPSQSKLYRSPSLSCLPTSTTLTNPIKYSYRNYGSGTFDQTTKHTIWPRFHMNTKNSFDSINRMPMPSQMQNIFRSASMHVGVSSAPWKPAGSIGNNGSKITSV